MQRGAWVDGVDAAGYVIFVPAAAGVFPDGVFDPFLDVLVELVGDVLARAPAAQVLVLHLFDPLDCVFGDGVQGAHYAAVWEGR